MKKFNEEIKGNFQDWSYASELRKSMLNREWQKKEGLWSFLSAACDDAAKKCYTKTREFAKNLVDVNTCSVDALRSIAESTGMQYLVEGIPSGLPVDVSDLVDKLSVRRHDLVDSFGDRLSGSVAERASKISTKKMSMSLLREIKDDCEQIGNILRINMISKNEWANVLETISSIPNEDLHDYREAFDGNPFFMLADVIKRHLKNSDFGNYLEPRYFDPKKNTAVDLRSCVC